MGSLSGSWMAMRPQETNFSDTAVIIEVCCLRVLREHTDAVNENAGDSYDLNG